MKIILALLFTVFLTSLLISQSNEVNIIPKPLFVKNTPGSFKIDKRTRIVATDDSSRRIAKIMNSFLSGSYGFQLEVTGNKQAKNAILIEVLNDGGPRDMDRYAIKVLQDRMSILGGNESAAFYALQSIFQLLPVNKTSEIILPCLEIDDVPNFPYRGMHLDVGRHFMPVEFVKKYIDLMAQYKFNFHWHLTEDQGWRIEIKKYPKLTEIGSKRPETVEGHNLRPYVGDKTPHEGFYTQDQVRDVVAYAKARYITVIPEIEMPGHSSAALAAYPEFGCKQDYQYKVQTTWGIFKEVYCPTEKTFQFLQDVIDEVIALFPDSPYIHIGGDEVLKDMWKDSPEVQELMKRENLKDVNEVQSYFVRRMEKYINSKGKKIIGWDEILEGGLAPNATVMSWRGTKGGIEAAKAHHDVIMTPTEFTYLNFGQGDPAYEPLAYLEYIPLQKVYSFDPVPKELSSDEAKYIIGGQGNLWTEYARTPQDVEYQLFPRMLALAEDLWTAPENKNYADFLQRLSAQYARIDKENVNYRIPEPAGLQNMVVGANGTATIELTPSIAGSKISYTLDGSTPTETSILYTKPINIGTDQRQRVDVKTITVLPNGRRSSVYAATILRRDYIAATEVKDPRAGVTYALMTTADSSPVLRSGETRSTGLQQPLLSQLLKQPFDVAFDGYLKVPADGVYEFQLEGNWIGTVTVDGDVLSVDKRSKDRETNAMVLPLKSGFHHISVRYQSGGDSPVFRIRWGIKGQMLRDVGGGDLAH